MTKEGDVILVYVENKPAFFARIEVISPDVKPEWFQVKMLVLQIPLVVITWILRERYINGDEFTMGGTPIRMERVEAPPEPEPATDEEEGEEEDPVEIINDDTVKESGGKVVSLMELKKKKEKREKK